MPSPTNLARPKAAESAGGEYAGLRLPEDVREAFVASLRNSRREVEVDARSRIAAAQARLERVTRLINAAYEDKLEGRIDDRFFNAKRAEWEAQRAEAADEIQRLTRASAKNIDTAIRVFELANRAYALLNSREPREQRRLLEVLFSNSVLAEGRLTVTWRKPFDVLAEAGSAENENGGDSDAQNRRHSVWSGWVDVDRTWWLGPKGWGTEKCWPSRCSSVRSQRLRRLPRRPHAGVAPGTHARARDLRNPRDLDGPVAAGTASVGLGEHDDGPMLAHVRVRGTDMDIGSCGFPRL